MFCQHWTQSQRAALQKYKNASLTSLFIKLVLLKAPDYCFEYQKLFSRSPKANVSFPLSTKQGPVIKKRCDHHRFCNKIKILYIKIQTLNVLLLLTKKRRRNKERPTQNEFRFAWNRFDKYAHTVPSIHIKNSRAENHFELVADVWIGYYSENCKLKSHIQFEYFIHYRRICVGGSGKALNCLWKYNRFWVNFSERKKKQRIAAVLHIKLRKVRRSTIKHSNETQEKRNLLCALLLFFFSFTDSEYEKQEQRHRQTVCFNKQ